MDKSTTATNDHALEAILRPYYEALANGGITAEYLVRKLKAELNARETRTVKIKGAVGELGRGFKAVATTGLVEYDEDGKKVYSDGETLIRSDQVAWGIRQKARMDAQKLMDLYPSDKVTIGFDHEVLNAILAALPEDYAGAVRKALNELVSRKRDRKGPGK